MSRPSFYLQKSSVLDSRLLISPFGAVWGVCVHVSVRERARETADSRQKLREREVGEEEKEKRREERGGRGEEERKDCQGRSMSLRARALSLSSSVLPELNRGSQVLMTNKCFVFYPTTFQIQGAFTQNSVIHMGLG